MIQGYASSVMKNFRFVQQFRLPDYTHKHSSLVVFGCYNSNDIEVLKNHRGKTYIIWMGRDATQHKNFDFFSNFNNISWLPKTRQYLVNRGVECKLVRPIMPLADVSLATLGKKVYLYCNKNRPDYYGAKLIDGLSFKSDLMLGTLELSQLEWNAGRCNEFYSQCFIGLGLSSFSGGVFSIIEMGLAGLKVITNTISLPHTIPWRDLNDINEIVAHERHAIGTRRPELAAQVRDSLFDPKNNNIESLILE